jgi:hypothetical protein
VEVLDALTGRLLARAATDDAGRYETAVAPALVVVAAYSRDADGTRVAVGPPDDPQGRFVLESPLVPLTGPAAAVDLVSGPTVRGSPGAPSSDTLAARAFAVYDALLAFWFQGAALAGTPPPPVQVRFPAPLTAGCGTTCYDPATRQIAILREDAFDWDVLGHEFFHFLADTMAPRAIAAGAGGAHTGGSAIGQPPSPGAPGRSRDEGMRLGWSEGLATFMALALQEAPPDPAFDFPRGLVGVGDRRYQDGEDLDVDLDPEAPVDSEGMGSSHSVVGLLWDLFDPAEGADTLERTGPAALWALLTRDLPCEPCDRVDRAWVGLTRLLGPASPLTIEVGRALAANGIAPAALAPEDGAAVSLTRPPTFAWDPQGDPSPEHRPDRFALALSRDGFRDHVAIVPVAGAGSSAYTPTEEEWHRVLAGAGPGDGYVWLVLGWRLDAPPVPEGWYWYSNTLRFRVGE